MASADFAESFRITRAGLVQQTAAVWNLDSHKRWIEGEHISIIMEKAGQSIRELPGRFSFILGIISP
jgi:hypothetical protein